MKFLSFEYRGPLSWGRVIGDAVVDLGSVLPRFQTLADYIGSSEFAHRDEHLRQFAPTIALSEIKFEPVITRPEKIICLARNYMDHHNEAVASGLKREVTPYPPIFLRVWRSQVGHDRPVILPKLSQQLDWEGELAAVISRQGRHIPRSTAMDYVAGYSCYNDISVRDFQHHAYQITPGKNFVGTGPFGPYLITPDELLHPLHLKLETRVNGGIVQSSNTSNLIFDIPTIISYCSGIFDLVPGDVIVSGTPSGVGWARKPQVWLKPGDLVEVEIEKVGLLSNTVVSE
jgi:2-keto-4-pentenoate hydratase/2-oxohepta-3-ene-1,7-dioic acid hydratase in catechol pathway